MTQEQKETIKKNMIYLGIGPSIPMAKEHGLIVKNYYSTQDYVTGILNKKFQGDPDYNIQFLECSSTLRERSFFIADHAFNGSTYRGIRKSEGDVLNENIPFYTEFTR